jgi:hypothetical protein
LSLARVGVAVSETRRFRLRPRERGPALLVPLAWGLVAVADATPLVATRTLAIAHGVMAVLLAAFLASSWRAMAAGTLAVWRTVIALGLVATLVGAADLALDPGTNPWLAVPLYAWILLPAAGLVLTGRAVSRTPGLYLGGGALAALGGLAHAAATAGLLPVPPAVGLVAVGVGQTVGMVAAAVQY